jgi:predicted RNA-binding Zn ribbon-like protein
VGAVPGEEPALALAVAFLNTYDLFPAPTDVLTVANARKLAERFGYAELGRALRDGDLDALRTLRGRLYAVFVAETAAQKVAALNAVLAGATGAELIDGGRRLAATGGTDAVARFGVVLADALAHALSTGGPDRFGTCAADPCRCAYVDRTRGGRQRYCCALCNDRMAAAAYRRRVAKKP